MDVWGTVLVECQADALLLFLDGVTGLINEAGRELRPVGGDCAVQDEEQVAMVEAAGSACGHEAAQEHLHYVRIEGRDAVPRVRGRDVQGLRIEEDAGEVIDAVAVRLDHKELVESCHHGPL